MIEVKLFHNFRPRPYQVPFLKAVKNGIKRVVLIWPRRHGKDKTCYNALVKEAIRRVGNYFYIFPEYSQGKKALWNNIDSNGFKTIDHAPKELVLNKNKTEMLIELVNGSTIQIIGASNIDSIVGSNPVGIVFSEFSLIDPLVWGYILPILRANDGFAWFNFTPRGNNHARKMYINNLNKDDWFVQKYTAKDCGVFTDEELEEIRLEYLDLYGDDDLFEQEYMTSFEAAVHGAYYGKIMNRLEAESQITTVPHITGLPVHTAWDLGANDTTAIWFFQQNGSEIRLIDYYEMSGEGLAHYAQILQEKREQNCYVYGTHYLPHDANHTTIDLGQTRIATLNQLGVTNIKIVPKLSVLDGIEAVRRILSRCFFDNKKCERGLDALREYHKDFDKKNKVWRNKPKHDWSSNAADAFRYLAVALDIPKRERDDDDCYDPDSDLFDKDGFY